MQSKVYLYKDKNNNIYVGASSNYKTPYYNQYFYIKYSFDKSTKYHDIKWVAFDEPIDFYKSIDCDFEKVLILDSDYVELMVIRKILINKHGRKFQNFMQSLRPMSSHIFITHNNYYVDDDLTSHANMICRLNQDDIDHENFASGFKFYMKNNINYYMFSLRNTNFETYQEIHDFVIPRLTDDINSTIITYRVDNDTDYNTLYYKDNRIDEDLLSFVI